MAVQLTVNGQAHTLEVPDNELLIDTLRDRLGLIGAHESCGTQICGSCTVLVDGEPVSSCCVLTARLDGVEVLTVEGLGQEGNLHPIQQAFIEERGFQCAFCTSGMMLTTLAFLREHPNPTRDQIREGLAGNICRCAGYEDMVRAVQRAAEAMRASGELASA